MDWAEFVAGDIPQPATVTVEPYEGSGPYGDLFGTATDVDLCVVEDTSRLVRVQTQDAAGAEKVSSTTVYLPPSTTAPPGSRVTLPSGRVTRVLAVSTVSAAGWDLPEHLELSLE